MVLILALNYQFWVLHAPLDHHHRYLRHCRHYTIVAIVTNESPLSSMVPLDQLAPMAIVIAIGTTHRIAISANGTAIVAIGAIGVIDAIGAIITNGSP